MLAYKIVYRTRYKDTTRWIFEWRVRRVPETNCNTLEASLGLQSLNMGKNIFNPKFSSPGRKNPHSIKYSYQPPNLKHFTLCWWEIHTW